EAQEALPVDAAKGPFEVDLEEVRRAREPTPGLVLELDPGTDLTPGEQQAVGIVVQPVAPDARRLRDPRRGERPSERRGTGGEEDLVGDRRQEPGAEGSPFRGDEDLERTGGPIAGQIAREPPRHRLLDRRIVRR